jgi:DNA-binding CsgD family transcriptional regulator/PAS domain-containing protein
MFDPDLNELIGGIYDAVIEPQRWTDAVDRIRRHFGFQLAMLGVHRLPDGVGMVQVASNVPQEFVEAIPRLGVQSLDIWGGPARLFSLPLEEPLVFSQIVRPSDIPDNDWMREWAGPQKLVDSLALVLEHDRRMLASLSFSQREGGPPITDAIIDGMRILAPHLRRAVTITGLIDDARASANSFEGALDASGTGVVLVGADLAIVHANAVATSMLDGRDPVVDANGRLDLVHEVAPGRLAAVVRAAADVEAEMGQSGMGVPARRQDGSAVVLHVMPLKQRPFRRGLRPTAVAAVLIAEPGGKPNLAVDALTALYGLRPAEVRIFEMMIAGQANRAMAETLGVKPSTVKTHVQSLFDKTGRHGRAGLIALAREVGAFL